MRLLRTFALRNYITLGLCTVALIAFLASGLRPASGSKDVPPLNQNDGARALSMLPNGNPTVLSMNPATGARRDGRSNPFKLKMLPASMASPFVTTLTATKTDNLNTPQDPGATIMYTVTITNTGAEDATSVMFTDTIDPNTALVPGSVNTSPIATNDSYTATGNVPIASPTSVLANDIDPDTGNNTGLTITQVQGSGANIGVATNTNQAGIGGITGSVTLLANGTFTYEPPPGFTGNDTFSYQISDAAGKTGNGTVTIVISQMVWFIDNSSVAVNSRGTFSQPFKTIANFNTVNTGAAPNPQPGHFIALRKGTGTGVYNEADGINLRDNQKLIGEAVAFNTVFTADANSSAAYNAFAAGTTTAPNIGTTAGNGVDLASGNTVRGLNFGTASGTAILGANVGTLTIGTVSVNTTGAGINLTGVSTPAVNVVLSSLTSSGGTKNVNLVGLGGTVNLGSGALSGATSNAFDVSTGTAAISYSGSVTQNNAARVVIVDGTTGGSVSFTGSVTGGASSTGVSINNTNGNVSFTTLTLGTSISRMTNQAVTINTGSAPAIYDLGTVSIFTTGGTAKGIGSTNTGGEIRTTTGVVDAAGASAVDITAAGTTPLLMTLTSVTANGGANGIRLTKTSGSFTVTGDGASDPANTTRGRTTAKQGGGSVTLGSGGTINNTTGAGVSLSTTTNVTLRNLSLTGNAGGLNSGADGINAASSSGLTLDNVLVSGHLGNDGLFGSAVSALTLQHVDIHTNAKTAGVDGLDIWDVRLDNLTGTCAVSNSLFFDTVEDVFTITNSGASNLTLTVTNSEFRDTSLTISPAVGDAGFQMLASGSAVTNLTATGCTFKNVRLTGFHYAGNNTSSGTVKVMNSVFGGTAAGGDAANQNGVDIDIDHQGQGTTLNFEVSGNTTRQGFRANASTSINIFLAGLSTATSLMTGTVKNNIVGIAGTANSGSDLGAGIALDCTGAGTMTASVLSNTVNQVRANSGNVFDAGTSQTSKLNLKIRSNIFNGNPAQVNPQYGIHINAGTGTPGETNQLCIDMGLNSVTMPASAIASVDLDSFPGTTTNLVGYTGAANNGIQIQNFFGSSPGTTPPGANTVTTPATLYTAAGGTTQPAVAPCNTFVFPASIVNPDVVSQGVNTPISDAAPESSTQSDDNSLRSTWGESPNSEPAEKLVPQALNLAVQAAIERWRQTGISLEDLGRLQAARFEIADLPGDQLALTTQSLIKLDETAAGYGWYVDPVPTEDSEFQVLVLNKELQTNEVSPANGKMDLLTVVMRELGNVYMQGKTKLPKSLLRSIRPLMEDTLSTGVRRMPLELLRVAPISPISSIRPSATDSRAQSNPTAQPKAGEAGRQPAASLLNNRPAGNGRIPNGTRYANFNPAVDQGIAAAAMMKLKDAGAASNHAANRALRVSSASPFSGEMINVGPFTLPVGKSVTIMFSATINAANTFPPGTTQVCNQGHVSATGIPVFDTNDPDTLAANDATCTQLNVADISVTKTAGSSPICSTSNITYTINYNNAGPAAAINALVSDVMPTGTSLVSVTTPLTWTRSDLVPIGGNGTITFTKASSANADAAVFTIVVSVDGTVADGAVIQNTATVTSNTPDPNTANNTSAPTSTTVKKPPTTATVGGPQTICALGTTAALGGNTPTIGTGLWTVQSGGAGTFNPNATTPGATFTHTSGVGPIVLRWTISNPPCPDSFAEVTITVRAQPTATVGGPQTICALGTTASLGGNTPTSPATGMWSIVTAGVAGTFNPSATTPGATFTHTSGGIGTTITLRWTVSNAPCSDATADVLITIKSQPTATVGGPQTICTGGTTAPLGGNTPLVGETGTWSIVTAGVTGTFNPTANTPGATFTHTSGPGPFVLRWTVSNPPCTAATADVTITLLPAPVATAGGPQTVCENGTTASLGGNTPAMGETGTWSIVTGGATGTFNPTANTPGATFSPTSGPGTITVRWTVTNPTCGASATADVIITVKQQPTATVGGPQTICALGTTASLGGNTPTGGAIGTWSIVTGGATGTFNPTANTPGATFTHTSGTGTIVLRWTVSNAPCADATADVNITITQPPTPATVGGPQTICAGSTTASLGGNTPTSGTGLWTIVTGGATGTFNPNATTPGATFTPTSGAGTIIVRWTISNPPCPASFAEVTITVKQQPTATAGGPQTICAGGTTLTLGGNTPTGGAIGTWSIVTGGATGTFNPNANAPGATFTHTGGTGTIVLRWTVSNPPCPDATADVNITITQSPTPATVGGNQTICALGTTAGLNGSTPASGTGTWTLQSGGTGTFNPTANTPNATFTHTGGTGPIVLRWTISNPPCPDSFAEVTITITQPPTTATVGGPQTICAGSTTASLGGNTPTSGTGLWTIVTGGATGTFNPNANTPGATFTPTSGAGTIVVRWTISNPPCPNSFAEVTITVKLQPTATTGGPQTICAGGTTATLGGNTPAGGATGTWTIVTGGATGTFNPNANTPGATFTHTGGAGTITLRWTVSNPPCSNATADVVLTITQPPTTATVGPNQTISPGGTTAPLGGNTPTTGTGLWTIVTPGATGTFNPNASTPGATWTHATGSGAVVLRWTISNPPCPSSQADVTIQIGVAPTLNCPTYAVVAYATAGQCGAAVSYTVTATGIPAPTVVCSPASGAFFPVGSTTVMCTASNGVLPNATCSFTVKVKDNQAPVFTSCPSDINTVSTQVGCPYGTTSGPVNFTVTATDNCSVIVVCKNQNNQVVTSGQTFPVGTTTVTCTATDPSGNTATCNSFNVTVFSGMVQDDTDPSKVVLFNAQTGQYRFCCGGTVYSGTGTVTIRGCLMTITHNPGDRRVSINTTEAHTGSASLQSPPGNTRCTLTDRVLGNNTSICQ